MEAKKHLQFNSENIYYYFSVYYAKHSWDTLCTEILAFYKKNKLLFDYCVIQFSEEQGEHINVILSSTNKDAEYVHNYIDTHFRNFLKNNISISTALFPYGEKLWMDYPNNSIVWYRFDLPYYIRQEDVHLQFSHFLSLMILELFEPDPSVLFEEELVSLATFFGVNLFKVPSFHYYIFKKNLMLTSTEKAISEDVVLLLDSYWENEFEEQDEKMAFESWLQAVNELYLTGDLYANFKHLLSIVCSMMNISCHERSIAHSLILWLSQKIDIT